MKRILFIITAAAALLFAAACQKSQDLVSQEDLAEVRFTVEVPAGVATKAFGEGLNATELYYAVFNQNKAYIQSLAQTAVVPVSGKTATLDLKLVRKYTYSIVFWAQTPGAPYTFVPETGTVTVSYAGNANDDTRDAFCALHTFTVPDAATFDEDVTLTRPFAQINFGASDFAQITELELGMKSTVKISGLADTYDILNGTLSGAASAAFTATTVPAQLATPETLTAGGTDYAYVSMNYVLAPSISNSKLAEVEGVFEYNGSSISVIVPNVPYQENHRTNIVGNFFTNDVTFNIIVDEAFLTPDFVL
jgi:hypothetical protein